MRHASARNWRAAAGAAPRPLPSTFASSSGQPGDYATWRTRPGRLEQRQGRGHDTQGAGQDNERQSNRPERPLGDAREERRAERLSGYGGRDEQEPQGDFRGLHQAAEDQDRESDEAHGQKVQRARPPELVLREVARGKEQHYRRAGEPGRGGERPAGRTGDEGPPPSAGTRQPDVPDQEQGREDDDHADPKAHVVRVDHAQDLDAGHDAEEGRDKERQREPLACLLPGIPYYGAVYDDREYGRQHDDRTGLVDEEEYGRADQGQPEARKPGDDPGEQRRKQRHEQSRAQ